MAYLEYCSNCGNKNTFGYHAGRKRYHCTRCGTIHYENPKPTATMVCPKGKSILLVKRAFEPAKGFWSLPGGFMELNETLQMAAQRELKEETNLNGKVSQVLGHCSHFNTVFGDVLLIGLLMDVQDYSHIVPDDDAEEAEFFPLDDLPPLAFRCHREIVDMYIRYLRESPDGISSGGKHDS